MKVPLKWLSEYVEVSLAPEALAQRLTMAGAEVEAIRHTGGTWEGVRVGQVLRVAPHPNADRLRLATVEVGDSAPHTVVCGAPNLAAGQRVAFAAEGAELIDAQTGSSARLKRARIRGVESAGMVCSERELGLSAEHTGILVLPETAPVGAPLRDVLGDTVLEISVTPNRPDLLSMLGVAREVAALTGTTVREPSRVSAATGPAAGGGVQVTIEAPELCPRYVATVVRGVTVGPSPGWMQERLIAAGMRPINNVVDITNYVMLEMGQPLHAFDYDRVGGRRIIVRRARAGEPIRLIDGSEQTLTPDTLVIADANRAVAVAGVMGGGDSEVTLQTVNVLLEAATFVGPNIRRSAAQLKVRTEASSRFEKGLHPDLAQAASERASKFLAEVCGGTADSGSVDAYPVPAAPVRIPVPAGRLAQVLGVDVPAAQVRSVLDGLGMSARWIPPDRYVVDVPYWRGDIRIAEDVAEEIARILGYDNLPSTPLRGAAPPPEANPERSLRLRLKDRLAGLGLSEAINYSATSVDEIARVQAPESISDRPPLRLFNPMSQDRNVLRTTLRPGLLRTYALNRRQRTGPLGLFEIGPVFHPRADDLPEERPVALALYGGEVLPTYLRDLGRAVDFFDAKAIAEGLLSEAGLAGTYEPGTDPALRAGHTALVTVEGQRVGMVGQVRPEVAARFDIEGTVFLVEMDVAALARLSAETATFRPYSRYPAVREDLAVVVDVEVAASVVEAVLRASPLVESVALFDVYADAPIPAGKKSLAYAVTYRAWDRTLSEAEVRKAREGLVERLAGELGVSIRE